MISWMDQQVTLIHLVFNGHAHQAWPWPEFEPDTTSASWLKDSLRFPTFFGQPAFSEGRVAE